MSIEIPQWMIDIVLWVTRLFTVSEWKAIVTLIAITLAGTHTLKLIWRMSKVPGGNHTHVHLIASGVALGSSYWIWPSGGSPWWVAGIIAGPAAIAVFKLGFAGITFASPKFAGLLNGDRRKEEVPPPNGVERRKS